MAHAIIISSDEEDGGGGAVAGGGGGSGGGGGGGGEGGDDDDDDDDDGGGGELAALLIPAPFVPVPEVAEITFPDFEGVAFSPEHKAYIVASKLFYRKQTQRRSKAKGKLLALSRLDADKLASLRWLPLRPGEIAEPKIGMLLSARWKAEQYARSWAAMMGVQGGIKMLTDYESLQVGCYTCDSFCMHFYYQPSTGEWALRNFRDHEFGCFGAPTPADGATPGEATRACKSAFTASQVARLVVSSVLADANMNMAAVRGASLGCFLRDPSSRFYKA